MIEKTDVDSKFVAAIQKMFSQPIESSTKILVGSNIQIDYTKTGDVYKNLSNIISRNESVTIPVTGHFILKDKSGKKLSEKTVKIADFYPKVSYLKAALVNGNSYQFRSQGRRKFGIYTDFAQNGVLNTEFILGDKLRQMKMYLINEDTEIPDEEDDHDSLDSDSPPPQHDAPSRRIFYLKIGNSNVLVYPILTYFGVTDADMEQTWGKELFTVNKMNSRNPEKSFRSFAYNFLGSNRQSIMTADIKTVVADVNKKMNSAENAMDAGVAKMTIDHDTSKLNGKTILMASKKLLEVSTGKKDPDFKQQFRYKKQVSFGQILYERLTNPKIVGDTIRRITKAMDRYNDIDKIVAQSWLTSIAKNAIIDSRLVNPTEMTNILDITNRDAETTIMGEGGVNNDRAVTLDARDVEPTSFGVLDPVKTSPGSVGTSLNQAWGSHFNADGQIKIKVYNLRAKKEVEITPEEYEKSYIAFPSEVELTYKAGKITGWKRKTAIVKGIAKGKVSQFPVEKADFCFRSPADMFSGVTNNIPFLQADAGTRAMYGGLQATQAVTLKNPDVPLIRVVDPIHGDIGEKIAWEVLPKASKAGIVKAISQNFIKMEYANGDKEDIPLLHNFPLAQGGFINHTPIVKAGQHVKAGEVLADTNQSKGGKLALGKNLNVAIMPYHGLNYDDGIVVSRSAADKLTSVHMYKKSRNIFPQRGDRIDPVLYSIQKPNQLSPSKINKYDKATGLIKVGETVVKGEILAPILIKRRTDEDLGQIKSLMKANRLNEFRAIGIEWEEESLGTIITSTYHNGLILIVVKTEEQFKEGDKLSDSHGAKGIVSKIVPDHEMPTMERTGELIDVIVDPHGIPSRTNMGQLYELSAGKWAKETGRNYQVSNFTNDKEYENLEDLMQKAGIPDKETILDPVSGRRIPNIAVGTKHIFKLRQQIDHKYFSTDRKPGRYDGDGQPIEGHAVDDLMMKALVGHGAVGTLREMSAIKGTNNSDFWDRYLMNQSIPTNLQTPAQWKKFEALIKGAGINMHKDGDNLVVMPMSNEQIIKMGRKGELKATGNPALEISMSGSKRPVKGGLFDTQTVGKNEDDWNYIALEQPIINPMYVKSLALLTGHSQSSLLDISFGRKKVLVNGTEMTGMPAVEAMIDNLDLVGMKEGMRAEASKAIASKNTTLRSTKINDINFKSRLINNIINNKIDVKDSLISRVVPVMPYKYRTLDERVDGRTTIADLNYLYKDIGSANQRSATAAKLTSETMSGRAAENLYQAVGALYGLNDPINRNVSARGIIEQISGQKGEGNKKAPPKEGFFQRKVLRKKQDISGRSTIVPDPTLDIDEVGIPREMAFDIFSPVIIRNMVAAGSTPLDAAKEVKDKTKLAESVLTNIVKTHPVLTNRAPSWSKYSVVALKPRIIENGRKEIRMPSIVVAPFQGGDFDGDQISVHVPITDKAIREAKSMMPSQNMMRVGSGNVMIIPEQSGLMGLHIMTQKTGDKMHPEHSFHTIDEARVAFNANQIEVSDWINLGGKVTTLGMAEINSIVPDPKYAITEDFVITKGTVKQWFSRIIDDISQNDDEQLRDKFARFTSKVNLLGENYATLSGFSIGFSDLKHDKAKLSHEVFGKAEKEADEMVKRLGNVSESMKDQTKARHLFHIQSTILQPEIFDTMDKKNPLKMMADVKSKGNAGQIMQIMGSGGIFNNISGQSIPVAVTTNFAKGMTIPDYMIQQSGARSGIVQKSLQTSEPGELGKELLTANLENIITEDDCGTMRYEEIPVMDNGKSNTHNLSGRFLAKNVSGIGKRNDVITEKLVKKAIEEKEKVLPVRSPIWCTAKNGVCVKCYGFNEHGRVPHIGDHVGINDAQAITELSATITLKAIHTTGAKQKEISFTRLRELIETPEKVKNKAIVVNVGYGPDKTGVIEKITPDKTYGGYNMYISGTRHYIPSTAEISDVDGNPIDKKQYSSLIGQKVNNGDRLTTGSINPHDLMASVGFDKTRGHLINELHGMFTDDKITRRTAESLVNGILNVARVTDPGDHPTLSYFDYSKASNLENINNNKEDFVRTEIAEGYELSRPTLKYKTGHLLTDKDISYLGKNGIHEVWIKVSKPIKFQSVVLPANMVSKVRGEDWLSKMNFQNLKQNLIFHASTSGTSDLHGSSPVPGYVYGSEFGVKREHKPSNY